jgi:hypothetical protein
MNSQEVQNVFLHPLGSPPPQGTGINSLGKLLSWFTWVRLETSPASPPCAASLLSIAGSGLIHLDGSPFQISTVQAVYRGLGFGITGHFHKPESFGSPVVHVFDDLGGLDLAESPESLFQILFGNLKRQIPNVNIHFLSPFLLDTVTPTLSFRQGTEIFLRSASVGGDALF